MKKYIVRGFTILLISFFASGTLFAQVALNDGDAAATCVTITTPLLRYQSRDAYANGEVSILQDFLIDKGLLTGSPTGFYGRMTVTAVKSYQSSKGVSQTGNVGPLTRSLIQSETCSGESAPICSLDTEYVSLGYRLPGLSYDHCACPVGSIETPTNSGPGYRFKCTTSVMCTIQVRLCPDGTTMPRDPNCAWREDKCGFVGPLPTYTLSLLPITASQALKTGVNYTTGWTGTGNPATPTYTVDLVKGIAPDLMATLGTATASSKSFSFSFPTTVVTGSDYRLRFGGTGGEMTNMFSIQASNTSSNPFSLSTSSFSFNYTVGGAVPTVQTLTFTNTTSSNISYTITVPNQPSWLNTSYTTTSLTAYPGNPTGLGALANPSGLSTGTYTTNIILTGNFTNSPIVIPVTLVVSGGAMSSSPKVTLSSSAASVVSGQSINLSYTVTNGTYCTATGNWNGNISAPSTGPAYWTGNVGPIYPPVGANYTLTCYNASGASDTQTIRIGVTGQ